MEWENKGNQKIPGSLPSPGNLKKTFIVIFYLYWQQFGFRHFVVRLFGLRQNILVPECHRCISILDWRKFVSRLSVLDKQVWPIDAVTQWRKFQREIQVSSFWVDSSLSWDNFSIFFPFWYVWAKKTLATLLRPPFQRLLRSESNVTSFIQNVVSQQCDQIGRNFAIWAKLFGVGRITKSPKNGQNNL
jgi:hypothetical protein